MQKLALHSGRRADTVPMLRPPRPCLTFPNALKRDDVGIRAQANVEHNRHDCGVGKRVGARCGGGGGRSREAGRRAELAAVQGWSGARSAAFSAQVLQGRGGSGDMPHAARSWGRRAAPLKKIMWSQM